MGVTGPGLKEEVSVSALARGLALLRMLADAGEPLSNRDLAERAGIPKATVSRLTFTLAALGYLSYSAEHEKYALGTAVLSLGHAFMKNNDVVSLARPLMRELAAQTQAAVMLGAADGLRMVLLEICQGDATFALQLQPGARVPHGSTALGRADLAARPQAVFDSRLAELQRDCEPAAWPRIHVLKLDQNGSTGSRSGEYGGSQMTWAPTALMASTTPAVL